MAYVTIPYSFTTGTASDAGKVNSNFTAIANGLSDGTKDLYVSQVKAASGTVTVISAATIAFTNDLYGKNISVNTAAGGTQLEFKDDNGVAQIILSSSTVYVNEVLNVNGWLVTNGQYAASAVAIVLSGTSLTFYNGILMNVS